jgi:hypothetical protein
MVFLLVLIVDKLSIATLLLFLELNITYHSKKVDFNERNKEISY